jgi:hypothetical protein
MARFKVSGDVNVDAVVRIYKEANKKYIAYRSVTAPTYSAVFEMEQEENVLVVCEKIGGGVLGYNYVGPDSTTDPINTYVPESPGDQRIYYDSVVEPHLRYPSTTNTMQNAGVRFCPYVMANFDYFTKCRWEMCNVDTGYRNDELIFNSLTELVQFKNNNVANNGSYFTHNVIFKPYDLMDPGLPTIDKLYGMNRLFAAFRGRRGYRAGDPHGGNMADDFNKGGEIMHAMFEHHFPTYGAYLTPVDFRNGNAKKMIWLPRGGRNLYGLPKNNSIISLGAGAAGGRWMGCQNWEGPNNLNLTSNTVYDLTDMKILVWRNGTTATTGSYTIYNPRLDKDRKNLRQTVLKDEISTAIAFYKVTGRDQTEGDKDIAIYVKPLGVDSVYINYFDTDVYDVECVYSAKDTQKARVVKVDPADIERASANIDQMGIPKKYWTDNSNPQYTKYKSSGYLRPPVVSFRLRNKVTNKISRLSRASIKAYITNGLTPVRWDVC